MSQPQETKGRAPQPGAGSGHGAVLADDPDAGTAIGRGRRERRGAESVLVRVVATAGIVGISTALAAILGSADVAAWIIGLVVSALSVILAAVLWSSRTL
jgi:hypothetical protein